MTHPESLPWTNDPQADRLLAANPLALLIGMLLDQQFPMERAFYGPYLISQRLGVGLAPEVLADTPLDRLEAIFRGPPAIHRFPNAMARRTQDLCRQVIDDYDGHAERLWTTTTDPAQLLERLEALPGFGTPKARIFVGILGKRLGVAPDGWETIAADWPSIADVEAWEDIAELRAVKRARKAARNDKERR